MMSISLGRQVLSKNGWSGLQSRRITKKPLPGTVWSQLLALPLRQRGQDHEQQTERHDHDDQGCRSHVASP